MATKKEMADLIDFWMKKSDGFQKQNSELRELLKQKELVEARLRKSWQEAVDERNKLKGTINSLLKRRLPKGAIEGK